MQIRCLGPLRAVDDGQERPLGGPKQRLVLAHLLIRSNQVVPADRLITEVWDGAPPAAARSSLQSYISHLRKALGADRLDSSGQGYALRVDHDEVDRMRFERLVTDARQLHSTDPAAAAALLRDALDLWDGPAFADLSEASSLQPEIIRLHELRIAALEDRVAADLDAGRERELVGELEALTAEHPLRERLWGQLMMVLYRSGRQGDALAAFDRARALLADELGVDPSAELRSLHKRVLRQDPGLQAATPRLKGYRLLERIGEGSFGVVWRARQPGVDRDVAIKAARRALANDPAFVRHFEVHAQRVARIEHPHVVPLYDFWREPDGAYLVLRYLQGGTLRAMLRDADPPDKATAVRIADQITQALAAAHQLDLAHGDIRPSNVLLDDEANAYLADFAIDGVADNASVAADDLPYVAPERVDGAERGLRADVFSLGILLGSLLADLDGDVTDVVSRATSRDPGQRQRDAAELLAELRAAIGSTPSGPTRPVGTAAPAAAARAPRNPYKGLRAFVESDAGDFFGRDKGVTRLLSRLRENSRNTRFLAVVGPSGSGKSSVVRAGLVPALRAGAIEDSETWFVAEMVPGARPFDELAVALRHVAVDPPIDLAAQLAGDDGWRTIVARLLPDAGELLLVVDQFEELFTLVEDDAVRRRFLGALVDAATAPAGRIRVVVTLRADFYDRPLAHHALAQLIQERTETVVPLGPDELERAVVGPAAQVGVDVERPLLARIVADVTDQPGGLPLLQFALTELFDARRDGVLSADDYRRIGGVTGALARRAEELFGGLPDAAREAARQLFLQLVTPGEGVEDTRRRVLVSAVAGLAPEQMPAVLSSFGGARLLTFDRDPETRAPTVEIAHEALLREWQRLRRWIDAARDDLRTHRQLQAAAAEWSPANRDPSYLATGSRLNQYETWRRESGLAATDAEQEYLDASIEARDRAAAEEAARRERELALERRSVRRLRTLVAVLAVAALVAGGLTIFASTQARRAADQTVLAEREARLATARELAAAADANLDVDPERSMLLAIEAIDATRATDGTVLREAEEALHRAVHASRVTLRVPGVGGALDWSPDGTTFVTEGTEESGVIDIRDAVTGASVRSWKGHETDVNDVVFSPDGSSLATAGDDGELRVWAPATGELLAEYVEPPGDDETLPVLGLSFSPNGERVAGVWGFERLRVVDVQSGDAQWELGGIGAPFNRFRTAFSSDGREIAVPSIDHDGVIIVDARTGKRTRMLERGAGIGDLAWSPDGRWIAGGWGVAGDDLRAEAYVFDAKTGALRFTLFGHSASVRGVDWSPDSSRLATASGDGTVRIWELQDSGVEETMVLRTAGMSAGVQGVAFSPDGSQVLAGEQLIARVIFWDVDAIAGGEWAAMPTSSRVFEPVVPVGDDRHVLTADPERGVTMWDPVAGTKIREYGGDERADLVVEGGGVIASVSSDNRLSAVDAGSGDEIFTAADLPEISALDISADGQRVAVATWEGPTVLLDATGGTRETLDVSDGYHAHTVAWSPDGALLAVGEDPDRSAPTWRVRLWDVERREVVHTLEARTNDVAFSPNGALLVVAQEDGATVWNVADGSLVSTLTGHTASVWSVEFGPDGETIATTSADGTVRLWEASTGLPKLVLPGHDITSAGIAFVADGKALASGGGDGVARVWALDLDDLLGIAQDKLTRGLTKAECREYLHADACPEP